MRYEWDAQKNEANIEKHGLDFADAERVFQSFMLDELDDRFDYGEDRWLSFGVLDGRVVALAYSEPDDDTRRIISMRKADRNEQNDYILSIQDRLGKS